MLARSFLSHLTAFFIFTAPPIIATASSSFDGDWGYLGTTGDGSHIVSAYVHLLVDGNQVTGDWNDGSDIRIWSGKLIGELRSEKAYIKMCSDNGWPGDDNQCPEYGTEQAVFEIEGNKLVWYQLIKGNLTKHLTLEKEFHIKRVRKVRKENNR